MNTYEYKLIDLPRLVTRKLDASAFAPIEAAMNDLGSSGWEYVRRETFEVTRKRLLGRSTTETREQLVFRRLLEKVSDADTQIRMVLKDPVALPTVKPRRVRNPEFVAEVKDGARRMRLVDAMQNTAAEEQRLQAV